MKSFLTGCLIIVGVELFAQSGCEMVESLTLEWKNEFYVESASSTGIIAENDRVFFSLSNLAFRLSASGEQLASFGGGYMMKFQDKLFFAGGPLFIICSDQGVEEKREPLLAEDNSHASAIGATIVDGRLYTITDYNFLLKYDLSGKYIFNKQTGKLTANRLISGGGKCIYVYSQINDPALGPRLMQFDSMGNEKLSVGIGDVRAIVADEDGNCFVSTSNGESTITKINAEGKSLWSTLVNGQHVRGMSKKGDSIFVCGHISQNGATSNWQRSCYSIILASTGALVSQQVLDIYEDPKEREYFDVITSDGLNIYCGGAHGFESNRTCFLIKLSREGISTGLKDKKETHSGFNIFPNPGGSKFTISCSEVSTGKLKITVRNTFGQVVERKDIQCNGEKSWELDLGRQAPGNYTVEILSGGQKVVKKIVLE